MKHPTYNPLTHKCVLVRNPECRGWPSDKPLHLGWLVIPFKVKPGSVCHEAWFTTIEPEPVKVEEVEEGWPNGWRWSDKK